MTNIEINLKVAVRALNEGRLTGSAVNFIEQIKDFDKKALKRLSHKQYCFLNDIYNRYKRV